jgi:hypothetical protein
MKHRTAGPPNNRIGKLHAGCADPVEVNLGNVPKEASVWAGGSFPSHQMGNVPIDFFGLSIGLLCRQICQKSDVSRRSVRRNRPARRTDPEHGRTHVRGVRWAKPRPPLCFSGGCARESP